MKLKKRLPESRSQKKERLAADRDRRALDRAQARDRREAWLAEHDRSRALYHEWRSAVVHRLDSEEAYQRFEEIHRCYWDLFRHIGLPSTEVSLALQRHKDARPADPEPLVEALESAPHFPTHIAHALKQQLRAGELTPGQKARVRAVVVHHCGFIGWHKSLRALVRLARVLDGPELRTALAALPQTPALLHVLAHLDQEHKMQASLKSPAT